MTIAGFVGLAGGFLWVLSGIAVSKAVPNPIVRLDSDRPAHSGRCDARNSLKRRQRQQYLGATEIAVKPEHDESILFRHKLLH